MGIYRASAVVSGFIFESTAALSVSSKIVKRPIPTPFTPYNQNSSAIIEKKSIFEGEKEIASKPNFTLNKFQ